ncbi:MAG: hypothetical protein EXX96DRAFT_570731 [Benjaminiella poitrasii]|nr:MAG: hypothetical protein EXX96DRAFT_570731 [Benjaminiella poitrasii]
MTRNNNSHNNTTNMLVATIPDLVFNGSRTKNDNRFSYNSCVTEDSIDSVALMTPLDASPLPPPYNASPIINIVNDDPFPNTANYPAIASAYHNRHRAQTPRMPGSSIIIQTIQHQSVLNATSGNHARQPSATSSKPAPATTASSRMRRFWPKIKHMISHSSEKTTIKAKGRHDNKFKSLFESMDISLSPNSTKKTDVYDVQRNPNNRWPLNKKNKARVGPQR